MLFGTQIVLVCKDLVSLRLILIIAQVEVRDIESRLIVISFYRVIGHISVTGNWSLIKAHFRLMVIVLLFDFLSI